MNKAIEVAKITARGNRIEYLLRDESGLGLFKEKSLTAWIEFHNAEAFGFAAENVPISILAVPIALYLYPATWFCGVDLVLPTIDKTLFEDLDAIYDAYSNLHGPFSPEWRGKVLPSKIEDAEMPAPKFERLVFFSGGVDAVHAALNNAGPKNVLASVPSIESVRKGKGRRLDAGKDFLEVKSRLVRDFSGVTKSPWVLVTNNFNDDIFDSKKVERDAKGKISTPETYFSHMVKLGNMLSAAPFAHALGIRTLVMGSGYTPLEGKDGWSKDGDYPDLSNSIKFSGAAFAEQDGFYTRRTAKVRNIANSPLVKEYKAGGGKLPFGPAFRILRCSAASATSA